VQVVIGSVTVGLGTMVQPWFVFLVPGMGGLIRYAGRGRGAPCLPVRGYLLIHILFLRFPLERRIFVEPLLVLYTGRLIAGWLVAARIRLRSPGWNFKGRPGVLEG
jgi:hypothetical protein